MSNGGDAERRKVANELAEENPPFYITLLHAFLYSMFFIYDLVVEIPFQMFANPKEKREASDRVKARPVIEGDPTSDWRNVETIDGDLLSNAFKCETLGDLWDKSVKKYGDNACMGVRELLEFEEQRKDGKTFQKLHLGEYEFETYEEVNETINGVVQGLLSHGLQKGDNVMIFAETRPEWMQTAFACFKCGLPLSTVYATLGEEAVAYAINEVEPKVLFTTRALLPKVAKALKDVESVETVIYFKEPHKPEDDDGFATPDQKKAFKKLDKKLESFDALVDIAGGGNRQYEKPKTDDLAVLMYTSGTTGNPKGVMLSHRNILAATGAQEAVFQIAEDDVFIGYLPLAHIFELCAELILLAKGARIGYSSAQTLFDRAPKIKKGTKGDCAMLQPTLMTCVPAVMDRIFKAVTDELKSKPLVFREAFRVCYERKRARYEDGYSSPIMNTVVFNKIRSMLGGHITRMLSGGAPLNAETQRFMNITFCVPVLQGYGLTETCAGATVMDPADLNCGSVGPPIQCCEIRLREWKDASYSPQNDPPQGEILIHGDHVSSGYFKNEEKTNEDFITLNGKRYFATGDIGEFRADGSLKIIDRKKDLVKPAHGEYISLGKVETTLLTNPLVDNICIYADSDHDKLLALVVVKAVAEELKKSSSKLHKNEVPELVVLCHEPWTPANGLLTEALKLKRKNIEKEYKEAIAKAYGDSK
ncbi:AMP-binding domain-containing protein [Aphelenchoides fujianensis]|nr:AMP-binding domain-containing protein [Aphelenchoides fujianensis]